MRQSRAYFLLIFAAFLTAALSAQKEDKAIKAVINNFFAGMEKGDTVLLKSACTDTPVFQTFMASKDGQMQVYTEDFDEFVRFIGTPTKDKYKEEITFEAIHAEKSLASVWTPYKFYVNGKVSHCGTNSFQLVKTTDGWKIQYIIDTRRRGCKE
ncbi:MAG: nuclear transport factor 2 family protein [Saprospiraceae bacterium]|nr:nuclear transport factor 2 family protein [Saprospiraceae bacterium]